MINKNEMRTKLLNIFKNVVKPSRYIGGEINSIVKDYAKIKVAMCFPDLYEIGINNLGMSILYEAINKIDYASCERVYSVAADFEAELIKENISLYSLETFSPIKDFDILGFTLQYELLSTNILQVLDLSKIAIDRNDRDDDSPIVIAGGPCVYNPLPLSNYIDVFFMGEYDDKINEIIDVVYSFKEKNKSRQEKIEALSKLDYAYCFAYPKDNVTRYFVNDLDDAVYPKKPIIPIHEAIQDRLTIEIARGCTHGCRFCSAGSIYRPVRNRSFKKIIEIVDNSIKATGADEINLASLSSDDYPNIELLVKHLQDKGSNEGFSVSLPSLHVDSFKNEIIPISQFKKTGLTFALESGSEEIRKKINKIMDTEAIFDIVKHISKLGYKVVKIYFMIGLTDCPKEEALAIIETLDRISALAGKAMRVNAAINVFVPKPHTSLQYSSQLGDEEAIEYIRQVRAYHYQYKNIFVKYNPPRMSVIEGLLSRGDERIGSVILNAYKLGCRLDAWIEHFDFDKWLIAVKQAGLDIDDFLKERDREQKLPWAFINVGVDNSYLEKEHSKYNEAICTDDCRKYSCNNCGIDYKKYCSSDALKNDKARYEVPTYEKKADKKDIYETECKIFARFKKHDSAAILGHFDLRRLIVAALKIADIKITMTLGFHPLPKVVFSEPISFAVESECEYFEISCYEKPNINNMTEFIEKINNILPRGIDILTLDTIDKNLKRVALIPKDSLFRIDTTDNNLSYNILIDKDSVREKLQRFGDYSISRDDNYIHINFYHSNNKPMRYKDINILLNENNIKINNAFKIFV